MKLKRSLAIILSLAMMLTSTGGLLPAFAEEEAPAAEAPAPEPPKPDPTKAPATPVPATPVPATPVPATPVPATPVPATPVPATPVPATPVPATPVPETPAPETPVPATPAPETPVPATPAPETPAPAEQPTAPAEQPATPAPTATATPDPAATATPEPTPTPEPTETPAPEPARVTALSASKSVGLLGQSMSFSFSASGAVSLKYRLTGPGGKVDSGTLSGDATSYAFTPAKAGIYTFELTAAGADGGEDSRRATVEIVDAPALKVSAKCGARSVFAGDMVSYTLSRSAASQLAACNITAIQGGSVIYTADTFIENLQIYTQVSSRVTDLTLTVTLTDIYQQTATASVTIPVAVHAPETYAQYSQAAKSVILTGDWPADLVAVAKTQVGYRESLLDFIVDDEGKRQGYTRYGDWYGLTYEGWCAMFACFCMHFADIHKTDVPYSPNPQRWINALEKAGLFAYRTEYEPQVGDLAFFDWQMNNHADHIGIISEVTRDVSGHVTYFKTIEGNSTGYAVTDGDTYNTADGRVTGYGLINRAYDRKVETIYRELEASTADYTVVAGIEPGAGIPARASLRAIDFIPGTDGYNSLSAQTGTWLAEAGSGELTSARFFQLLYAGQNGESYKPLIPVRYTVICRDITDAEGTLRPGVIAFDANGGISKLENVRFEGASLNGGRGGMFTFTVDPRANDVAVIGLIVYDQAVYEDGHLSFSGPAYDLRLDFDAQDRVPLDAALSAVEYEADTPNYGTCVSLAGRYVDPDAAPLFRFFKFDISSGGEKIVPAGDVEVTITCPQTPGSSVKVLRLSDGQPLDATLTRDGESATVRFETSRFEIFCLAFED